MKTARKVYMRSGGVCRFARYSTALKVRRNKRALRARFSGLSSDDKAMAFVKFFNLNGATP